MNENELYEFLKEKFNRVIEDNDLAEEKVVVTQEGTTLNAEFRGSDGQVVTHVPSAFSGTIREVAEMDLTDCRRRSIFLATVNAVMCSLGQATRTTHCVDREPDFCAENITEYVKGNYGRPKIALIGSQEEICRCLKKCFEVKAPSATSLADPETKEAVDWADLVLCTGSVICDGTLCEYLSLDKEVIFYGTSLSGTAEWLGVKRLCF